MNIGDWITLAAVVVALGLGVASILHTQYLQKKERKEILLNEIIEWSIDCHKVDIGKEIDIVSLKGDELKGAILFNHLQIMIRGEYIKNISSLFGRHLHEIVDNAIKSLEICFELYKQTLKKYIDSKTQKLKQEDYFQKSKEIDIIASLLIEETTKIKTKNIS